MEAGQLACDSMRTTAGTISISEHLPTYPGGSVQWFQNKCFRPLSPSTIHLSCALLSATSPLLCRLPAGH